MIAYKIVKKQNGKLKSYCIASELKYELYKTTKPLQGDGPLACFLSLKGALAYFKEDHFKASYKDCPWDEYSIYQCDIEPYKSKHEYYLWRKGFPTKFYIGNIKDVVTAKSVKLLREIPYEDYFDVLY